MKKITGTLLLLLFIIQGGIAQFIVKGRVVDENQNPLQAVTIQLDKKQDKVLSDSTGQFSISSNSAITTLYFSHVGYEPIRFTLNGKEAPLITLVRSNGFLSETIVHSYEHNSSIRNIPAAVTVLNRQSLERYGSESFVPAVNTVPGVKMDERSPGSYRLSIRGNLLRSTFGVRNVKVYWNGIPLTDANGNTYVNEIAFNNINKIEILKGPSGSMYGSGTGGVLLLSSGLGSLPEKSLSVQATGGSYGLFSSNVAYKQAGKNSTTAISFSHQQSDGYRKQTNMRRDAANFTGSFFISNRQNISANILYSDLYYETPGALTLAELKNDPKQARPAAGIFRSAEAQQAALYLKTLYAGFANEYRFNKRWNNTTALYFSHTNFKNPTIRNFERKTEQGIGMRSVTKYSNRNFTGVAGAEYQYSFTNTSTFGNRLGELDTLQYHDEIDARQFNIFLQGDLNLPAGFVLNAGLSYNNFHYGFVRLNQLPSVKESADFTPQLIPRISLLKKIMNRLSVYAAVSKGFSPPSIDEVHAGDGNFNKQLQAESGLNYETGIKGDIIRNKLSIDAAWYWFRLNNTIVSRRDAAAADFFVNAGKTRQNGFEISLQYFPVNNTIGFIRLLKTWTSYTNIHARFINYEQGTTKYDGNKLTGTSPNVFVCGADVKTSIGIYTNITYSYTDKLPLNDANSFFSDAYNLAFIKLGYDLTIGKKISTDLFISYDKCFNSPYSLGNDLNAAGNRFYNSSSPQNIYAGFTIKFILP